MTNKMYKSAMGKTIDMGALMLKNEEVRAVGNMGVNARGDVVDSNNQPIDSKKKQVQRQYNRQVNTSNIPVTTSTAASKQPEDTQQLKRVEKITPVAEPTPVPEDVVAPKGGLAAAIARSKEVKQELLKTPRQLAQEQAGVKKI